MSAVPAQLDLDYAWRPRQTRAAYFNTTALTGEALASARKAAKGQDVLVLAILRARAVPMTPSDVWRAASSAGSDLLLTSVRRSMSTLTREQLLVKLETTAEGPFGRPERQWVAR